MANKLFDLTIVTPEKIVYEGKISSLIVPAELGYLGVLADHMPLIANLVKGKVIAKEASGKVANFYAKERGFIEVLRNKVTVILN